MALSQRADLLVNDKPYMLVRSSGDSGARSWQEQGVDEPDVQAPLRDVARSQDGEVRIRWNTKHRGFGEPIRQIEGRDYYGRNIDKRYPQQISLARALTSLPPGVTPGADPFEFAEFGSNLYLSYGRYVLKINPATDAITTAFDNTTSVLKSLVSYNGKLYLACGESAAFRHSADGATWTAHAGGTGFSASFFRVAEDRLYRIWKGTGTSVPAYLTNNSADPTSSLNWAAQDPIGDVNVPVTRLANSAYQLFIAKEDGLYAADIATGRFPSLTPELAPWRSPLNGQGTFVWGGMCFLPTIRGLKMFYNGTLYSTGPEVMSQNDSEVTGRFTFMAGDANWLFGGLYNGTDTYILAGRETRPDDNYPGNFLWNVVWYVPGGPYTAGWISGLNSDPRLWLASQTAIKYIKLGDSLDNPLQDASAVYETTGTDYYPAHDAGSPMVDKHFLELRVYCENLSQVDGRFLTWSYRLDDDTTWHLLGKSQESPVSVLKFDQALDVVGRRIALKCVWTRGSTTTETPVIRNVEVLGVEFPPKKKLFSAQILCADNVKLRSGVDSRSAAEVAETLQKLVDDRQAVSMVDPLGRKKTVLPLAPVLLREVMQTDEQEPMTLATANYLVLD